MRQEELSRLRGLWPGRAIEHYQTIGSTMHAAVGRPLGTVILAEEQTAGQGRHGHSWHSERGSGIYCSIVLRPAPLLTLALGLATLEAITTVTGVACDLRWPNDLMVDGKKAAGILVQLAGGRAIGGIGINVNQTSFPAGLGEEATSLRLQAGREFDRAEILRALLSAIDSLVELDDAAILRHFAQASSYAIGRRVSVQQGDSIIEGITAGLDASGYLIVRQDDGTDALIVAGGVRAARS